MGRSLCPGIAWLPGICGLFGLHSACFIGLFAELANHGLRARSLFWLAPVVAVWLLLSSAGVKFRLQRPTRDQRNAFDNAAINWFGMVTILLFYPILLPLAVGYLLWTLFL